MKGKIFNAQEVQAIIAGTKTMFREVIKNKTNFGDFLQTREAGDGWYKDRVISMRHKRGSWADYTLENFVEKFCPYQVGQKIFCKEAWGRKATGSGIAYKADNPNQLIYQYQHLPVKWRLPQHMKQEHSRLTLEITDIKVERLKDISEDDAIKEGVNKLFTEEEMKHVLRVHQTEKNDTYKNYLWHGHIGRTITKKQSDEWEYQCSAYEKAKDSFFSLWNATHKKPEEKFEVNPFVWVVDFKINNLGGL